MLVVFDEIIADIASNKKLEAIVTELFVHGRKLGFFSIFMTQSYFAVQKIVRLNPTHYFIIKIPNRERLEFH